MKREFKVKLLDFNYINLKSIKLLFNNNKKRKTGKNIYKNFTESNQKNKYLYKNIKLLVSINCIEKIKFVQSYELVVIQLKRSIFIKGALISLIPHFIASDLFLCTTTQYGPLTFSLY